MKEFKIGGHSDMSLEEVHDYQTEGWREVEKLRDEFPPDEETRESLIEEQDNFEQELMGEREPDAELSHQGFIEEQEHFEQELLMEREPGAELSHQEFIDEQDRFEAEIMSNDNSSNEITKSTKVEGGGIEQEEGFDPEWANPSYDQIVAEPDAVEDGIRAEDEDFVKSFNTASLAALDSTIDGLDTFGLAETINENDTLIEKEIDFGYGVAESMHEGSEYTATDVFTAESDFLASQSIDIDSESDSNNG